jgi:xylan 1,4-beta-xylosidase
MREHKGHLFFSSPQTWVLTSISLKGHDSSTLIEAGCTSALLTDEIVRSGVQGSPDIDAMAARNEREVEVLMWNYYDDDVAFPAASIDLMITNLPPEVKGPLFDHFRVDSDHSNGFTVWRSLGSPESLSASQIEQLQNAGQLQLLTSPVEEHDPDA